MNAYLLLADTILLLHFAIVGFVVMSLPVIWLGSWRRWGWVRDWRFRGTHLLVMGFVAVQAILGRYCPLTVWENRLRELGGRAGVYDAGFIEHWVHRLMFFNLPLGAFAAIYVVFFGLLVATVWRVPPKWPWREHPPETTRERRNGS